MRAPRSALLLALVALHLPAARAAAQRVGVSGGAGLALADYREQGTALRFRGAGPSGHVAAGWRRFALRLDATRLTLEGAGPAGTASEPFDLTQLDVRVSVRVAHAVSVETGLLSRVVSPRDAAQEVGAARLGARLDYALAPGAALTARAGYLGAARFSGGGSAPFGVEAGLGVSYGPGEGRIRVTTDFDFQRFDRRTTVGGERLGVPIQSAAARVGVELRL
jgi:hypothetical protein